MTRRPARANIRAEGIAEGEYLDRIVRLRVGVYLSVPRYHGSTRYYGKMSVELSVGGHLKWETGYFTAPKGLTSYWKFPLIWPYL